MASNKLLATVLVLSLLSYSTFTQANCPPTPTPTPTPTPPTPKPTPPTPKPTPPTPKPTPPTPKPTPPTPKPTPPTPVPSPKPSCPPPSTPAPPPSEGSCPKDTLKLGVCAKVLGLVSIVVGTPPTSECCALIKGLSDLEAALCLCTAFKANVLGINLNVPVKLSVILSACQKTVPPDFQCPS